MKLKRLYYFLTFVSVFAIHTAIAQGGDCGCTNCPQFMPDNFQGDFLVNVIGATNDNLSHPNQGICEIRLEFDHQYIGDLAILLTSPSGQEIELVGPIGMFGDTDLSSWDISFVPCAETPMPDLGFGVWQNEELTAQNFQFDGSYHPFGGCLEDFDMGPINGTWTLTVIDDQAIDFGTFIDYEIIFCDDDGINCNSNPCGVFASAEAPSFACDGDVVVIDASASVGNFFQWGTADGSFVGTPSGPFAQVSESGTYSVTVSDNGNCPEVATVIFNTVPELPTIDITASNPLDCNNSEATLMGVTSVTENLFVNWVIGTFDPDNFIPISTELDLTIFEPGTYTMIVVDTESACSETASITIEDESIPPNVKTEVMGTISCGMSEAEISVNSDLDNASYVWSGPNDYSSTSSINTVSVPGIYNVTVTAPNGCIDSSRLTVLSDTLSPTVTVAASNNLSCFNLTAELITNTTDEINSFSWSGPSNYENDTILNPQIEQAGIYTLTATNANGCVQVVDITVAENIEDPVVQIGNNYQITCGNDTISIDGSGSSEGANFSYAWTDEDGNMIGDALAIDLNLGGNYTLEITNLINGCRNMSTITVDDLRNLPEVEIQMPDTLTCYKPMVPLIALDQNNKSLEYSWVNEEGNILNMNPSDVSVDVEQAGSYGLTITDVVSGCTSSYTINVEANLQIPDFNISSINNNFIDCDNTTLILSGNLENLNVDDVLINWTTIGGNFINGQNTLNPEIDASGTYHLEITNLENGCSNTSELSIMQDVDMPLASLNDPGDLNCTTQSLTLSTPINSNTLEVTWLLDGTLLPNENTNELVVDQAGEYMVVITNPENGCSSQDQINIIQDIEVPIIDAGEGSELQCNISEITLNASINGSGNYEVLWNTDSGNIVQGGSTLQPLVDQAGTYMLQVINPENGCIIIDSTTITINENMPIHLLSDIKDPLCEGDLGAISNLEVIGGESPYLYSIDGGDTFSEQGEYTQLSSGDYNIEAIDANGCIISSLATIEEPNIISIDLGSDLNIIADENPQLAPALTNIDPSDIQTILWTPSFGLSCDDCLSPTTTTSTDILYTLDITLASGCSVADDIQVSVDRDKNVYIPNAFTPFNLDGYNDAFYLFAKEGLITEVNRFAIYDRWGNEVFLRKNIQPNDARAGWNGNYKGQEMPTGVYIYIIEVEFRNGISEIFKGNLLLSK